MDKDNNHMNDDQLPDFFKENKGGFDVPENYFNDFQRRLFAQLNQEDELKEFATLSRLKKEMPFVVPAQYFEVSAGKINEACLVQEELRSYKILAKIQNSAFSIPEDYFDSVHSHLQYKIEMAEELKAYPLLNALDKVNCFDLPDYYFDDLRVNVQNKLSTQSQNWWAGVLQFLFQKKLAYAMGLALVLGFLYLWNSYDKNTIRSTDPCNELACLGKNEILKSNLIQNLDEESLMDLIDEKNIADTLNSNDPASAEVLEDVDANAIMNEL